ncbi:hypothetical protein RCO27_17240 [Sphingosinicella sp. LHD-64]|uniref:hypothetical protein n=1 Tax=Sphingosinicella sp. LHD-64 TaxID=3072139 RepID=UPI00281034EE|nr:hypothetical protein [Sphingosinicella sp. LHD-64]MDQ8757973.1 hypothetical protein [Sphingosinicella sp. LHD-64]
MTNDSFLSDLGADWRRQTADLDRLRARTERQRRRTRLALIAKAAGAAIALLSGVWFVWLAFRGAPTVFALAGIVLLVSLPLMLLELAGTARALRVGHDDTPAGVLRRARDQAVAARQLLWAGRVAALLMAASAAGLAALFVAGRARTEDTLAFVPLWTLVALGGWVWQARRARRLAAEIARCDALLAELREAGDT